MREVFAARGLSLSLSRRDATRTDANQTNIPQRMAIRLRRTEKRLLKKTIEVTHQTIMRCYDVI